MFLLRAASVQLESDTPGQKRGGRYIDRERERERREKRRGEMKNGYTKVALRAVMGRGSEHSAEICWTPPAVFKSVSQQPQLAKTS